MAVRPFCVAPQFGLSETSDVYQFFTNPMVEEMANALSVKCEPCLLTDYTQLFVALDGILGANLDFELQGGWQSVVRLTPMSSGKTFFPGGNTVFFGTGCADRKHS